MSDRVSYALALPGDITPMTYLVAVEAFWGEELSARDLANSLAQDRHEPSGTYRIDYDERRVGEAAKVADDVKAALAAVGIDIPFTVYEEGYHTTGYVVRYQPTLGIHQGPADDAAEVLLSASQFTAILNASKLPTDALGRMAAHFGTDWNTPTAVGSLPASPWQRNEAMDIPTLVNGISSLLTTEDGIFVAPNEQADIPSAELSTSGLGVVAYVGHTEDSAPDVYQVEAGHESCGQFRTLAEAVAFVRGFTVALKQAQTTATRGEG